LVDSICCLKFAAATAVATAAATAAVDDHSKTIKQFFFTSENIIKIV
jgi:hypothetical protein